MSEPPADGLTWDARWRSWARPPRAGGARPDRAGGGRRGARGDPAANPGARAPGVAGPARASAAALCRRADSGQLRVRDTSARSHERRRWAAWRGGRRAAEPAERPDSAAEPRRRARGRVLNTRHC